MYILCKIFFFLFLNLYTFSTDSFEARLDDSCAHEREKPRAAEQEIRGIEG